jgi:YgiT-type zinc finger domain-containing protein
MSNKPMPTCGDRQQTAREWKAVTFEYTEDGVSIRVPNVYAWVCPLNGEISFTPDTVDELLTTVRKLIDTAKRAQA